MPTHLAPRKHRTSSSHGPAAPRPEPPRYKLALLSWAGAYAVITLILTVLGPAMVAWPLALRTLLLSALMAPAMTWLVIPFLTRLFASWLHSASPRRARPLSPPRPSWREG
jgi:antibiotic biosynthesis monooxygenase (ABM) superfamily enzyme